MEELGRFKAICDELGIFEWGESEDEARQRLTDRIKELFEGITGERIPNEVFNVIFTHGAFMRFPGLLSIPARSLLNL